MTTIGKMIMALDDACQGDDDTPSVMWELIGAPELYTVKVGVGDDGDIETTGSTVGEALKRMLDLIGRIAW